MWISRSPSSYSVQRVSPQNKTVKLQGKLQSLIIHPFSSVYPYQGHGGLEPIPATGRQPDAGLWEQASSCCTAVTLCLWTRLPSESLPPGLAGLEQLDVVGPMLLPARGRGGERSGLSCVEFYAEAGTVP